MAHFQCTISSCKLIEKLKFHLHKSLQVYNGELLSIPNQNDKICRKEYYTKNVPI